MSVMDRAISRPPVWRQRRVLIGGGAAAGALALVVLAVLAAGGIAGVRVPAATVTIDAAQDGVFHDFVPLKGKAAPKDEVYLDALDGGQVAEVLARSGDAVIAGQPLVRFRNTELELDVLDREGRLVESITQLQTYEKELEETRVANEKAAAGDRLQHHAPQPRRGPPRAAARQGLRAARGDRPAAATSWPTTSGSRPLQADTNRRQEALRQAQLPQIDAEMATLQREPRRHPQQARQPRPEGAGGRQAHRGRPAGGPDRQAAATGSARSCRPPASRSTADIDEYYLGRVAARAGAPTSTIDGGSYPMVVTRVNPQVKDVDLPASSSPSRAAQPPGLLPGEALEGKLAVGGDRPRADPAGRRLPGAHRRRLGDGGLGRRRPRRAAAHQARRAATPTRSKCSRGFEPGERVITSDYAAFEKVDRVDLSR